MIGRAYRERSRGSGVGLVIGGFGLHEAGVDVLRVEEVVLNDGGVLGGSSNEPDRTIGALADDTATGVDVDLGLARVVKIVIGSPDPGALGIDGGLARDVETNEGSGASGGGGMGSLSPAVADLDA